jgi:hypothetical protein
MSQRTRRGRTSSSSKFPGFETRSTFTATIGKLADDAAKAFTTLQQYISPDSELRQLAGAKYEIMKIARVEPQSRDIESSKIHKELNLNEEIQKKIEDGP